jgi:hypothetical protein
MWQPETWVQMLQPIVNFLNQVVQRLGCNTEDQLQQMQQSVASLQQTAQAFKEHGACAGDYVWLSSLQGHTKWCRGCALPLWLSSRLPGEQPVAAPDCLRAVLNMTTRR